eukprot:TRINITY_DN5220_c2_g4_i1.p1 TRINITY_DN5220_c2_g4~~TRINITY_DN5220_c2_g4_i1.p1  ORF type:complete len:756 (-),score=120.45 TRINITY_DN5220_c2_g4_i1:36-2279(-)
MVSAAQAVMEEICPPPEPVPGEKVKRPGKETAQRRAALDSCIERVLQWLRNASLTAVQSDHAGGGPETKTVEAVGAVMDAAKRHTWQQTKALKHRTQVEAIAAQCLRHLPSSCELIVEMGAGQGVLGHAVSMASNLPLLAIERRGNADAFDKEDTAENATGGSAPVTRRLQADIGDDDAWPETGQITLLAKHLCGFSSDLAIDAAVRLGSRLSLLCLAPCCHATMSWTKLSPHSQQWFEDAGFPCSLQDFSLLVDVIRLSRAGTESSQYVPCAKWRLRQHVDQSEIESLGRKACRAIDEARLARLRAVGLDVKIVEYCDGSFTPDNVLILAAPAGELQEGQSSAIPQSLSVEAAPSAGVLLEIDPSQPATIQQRLVSYLHEQKMTKFLDLLTILPITDSVSARTPGLVCHASDEEQMNRLLAQLMRCPLIKRVVTRLMPYDQKATSCEAVASAVTKHLSALEPPGTIRVFARPRELERKVITGLPPACLSPARFTHMLFISPTNDPLAAHTTAEETGGGEARENANDSSASTSAYGSLQFALLPREVHEFSSWSAERQGDDALRSYWRCAETAIRWPSRFKHAEAVVLLTDKKEAVPWLETWSEQFLPRNALATELRVVGNPKDGAAAVQINATQVRGASGECGTRASVLLADIGCGGDEAVDTLQVILSRCTQGDEAILAERGIVVVRLRCGRKAKAVKRWHKEIAQQIESKLNAERVELMHLLTDRDPERTAVFSWDGPPKTSGG